MPADARSTVLSIRVPAELDGRIARAARRRKSTKSALLREAIASAFGGGPEPDDPAREARRQSLLVSGRASEADAVQFVEHAADARGWR